jgi:serine/threonine-protein kinase
MCAKGRCLAFLLTALYFDAQPHDHGNSVGFPDRLMSFRPPTPGALVDNKYRLAERIGGGGMGDVFRAENVLAARSVAIKFLHPELALSVELSQRFFQEAQAVNRIRHPNVVDVLDAGVGELGPYIVMELLDGESVGSALTRVTRFDVEAAVATALPVLEALDAAHRAGIIHRDLKPENVFLAIDAVRNVAVVRLLDFGIAKVLDSSEPSPRTRTGVVFGTPDYLSPEQATGESTLDGRSDLFSVGVLLYELLTGARPFRAPTAVATAFKVVHAEAPSLAAAGAHVDPRLEAIVARLLQKEPDKRFPTALEVIRELERVVPDPARRTAALGRVVATSRRTPTSQPGNADADRTSIASREGPPAWRRAVPGPAQLVASPSARSNPFLSRSSDAPPQRHLGHEPPSLGRVPIPPPPPSVPHSHGAPSPDPPRVTRALAPELPRTTRSATTETLSGPSSGPPSVGARPSTPTLVLPVSTRAFPTRFAGIYHVRGPVLRSVDKVVLELFGPELRQEIVEQMPEKYAGELRNDSINALVAYDLEALDAYMELATTIAVREPARWKELGRLAVDGELHNVVRTLLRPEIELPTLLRRGISVWARLFSFGTWRVTTLANGRAGLHLGELDPAATPLRQWIVGVVEQIARRAVRADVRAIILQGEQSFTPEMICELG